MVVMWVIMVESVPMWVSGRWEEEVVGVDGGDGRDGEEMLVVGGVVGR